MKLKRNDFVMYNHAWCTEAERNDVLIVLEAYDDVQRGKFGSLTTSCAFGSVQTLDYEMVDKVSSDKAKKIIGERVRKALDELGYDRDRKGFTVGELDEIQCKARVLKEYVMMYIRYGEIL